MDRPPSTTISRPSTATSHKRAHSSVHLPKNTAIALFVRNVRLLDLDLLPDWPRVTATSLQQDGRTRIRGAEWCLYHLFRLHDLAMTTEKLQPFFPPLEPLQSINLRAALYRCLNEVKKNGVLGKDTVLRKSMLDDCQGDKFWELCLSFSSTVLRAVKADKQSNRHSSVAEATCNAQSLTKCQRESLLPLAIAHKAALTRLLSQKAQQKRAFARLCDALRDKEEDLRRRKLQALEHTRDEPPDVSFAEEVLEKDWIGSNDLRDAIRNGDEAAGEDTLLTRSFASIWTANEQGRLFAHDATEAGILEDLEHRAQYQDSRLQRWQSFHERLLSIKPPPSQGSEFSSRSSQLQFDQHQNMTLRDMADNPKAAIPSSKHQKHDSVMKYDEILTAMREELRKNSAAARTGPQETEVKSPTRAAAHTRTSATHDSVAGTIEQHHHRSHSQTAVRMRPPFGKRLSSRSRSYQQPKVISQREPIPLKSELFSPLKSRRTSMSPASSGRLSQLASPIEAPSPTVQFDDSANAASQRSSQNSDVDTSADLVPSGARGSGASTPMSTRSGGDNPDSAIEMPSKVSSLGVPGRATEGYSKNSRPSLADRTRMSMAFKSADDASSVSLDIARSEPAEIHNDVPFDSTTTPTKKLSLHERTRQSISLAPSTSAPQSRKPTHNRSQTAIYPVNQFETPQRANKPRRSTLTSNGHVEQQDLRSITPREKLFEQDAEYASIFKARPKVALSPVLSPYTDTLPGNSDDDDVVASPLGGR